MKNKLRQITVSIIIIIFSTFLSPLVSNAAYDQSGAQSYLLAHSNSPWATMGLAALGSPNIPTDYLKNTSGTNAVDFEAPILAMTSVGQNPRTFGASNLVDKLKSFYSSGQIGDPATFNDDVFGILALSSAGVSADDAVVAGSKSFLLSHQNSDGGWGFSSQSGSDSNTTASAITSLIAASTSSSDSHIQNALNYLKTAQNDDGGFTYDPKSQFGTASDSSSTAWVMWALTSAGLSPSSWTKSGHGPADYLSGNQTADGLFEYQKGTGQDAFSPATTGYAVIALAGKTLPIKIASASSSAPNINFRIEGSTGNICAGSLNAANAMDVIKTASVTCNFTYDIKQLSFGPYLDQINNDAAAGSSGWLYLVNNTAPAVGAADYQTKSGDSVLWYFGDDGWPPLQMSLSADTAGSGQAVTATVKAFSGGAFAPLAGATVYFGTSSSVTDSSGQTAINAPDGFYKIYAQKTGYIRSNPALLKIGQPSASSLPLTANFSGGQVNGTSTQDQMPSTLSFTVDAQSLDFGSITPGSQKNKSLKITNTGSSAIKLSASVSGDPLFTNNLSLNNSFWQNFSATANIGQSQTVTGTLKIPSNFTGASGPKNGQLVLWASPE